MPTQNRVRREQCAELLQSFATEDLAFGAKPSTLIVIQQNPLLAELLLKYLILGSQIFDDFLLLTIHPTGENHHVELPGPKNEHDREAFKIFTIVLRE